MKRLAGKKRAVWTPDWCLYGVGTGALVALAAVFFSIPFLVAQQEATPEAQIIPFPVTVDPHNALIREDPAVEAMLDASLGRYAAALSAANEGLRLLAGSIAGTGAYQLLAAAGAPEIVVVYPGFRKEEVVRTFDSVLGWSTAEEKAFLESGANDALPEGIFPAGTYALPDSVGPEEMRAIVDKRFEAAILARYSSTTEALVPLETALTIASLIEREAGGTDEMRLISGIIWNRIFADMRLQIDATLQYAKASASGTKRQNWWPVVYPRDKYIKSPYNTYRNEGLPPAPIATPSVAAVIAALNPKKTDCFYYFHDEYGGFHCSETYDEHVAALTREYGRGK
jgi:UPF0755 protein